MSGPEYLDDEPPASGRGRTAAALAVVLLVLAALVVIRLQQPSSSPAPSPTVAPTGSVSPRQGWPTAGGLEPGTLFVAASGRVHFVDASSGLLTSTHVAVDPFDGVLTPIGNGVMVQPDAGPPTQLLLVYGASGFPPLDALRDANSFRPGADGTVWAARTDPQEPDRRSTWRRVDVDGHVRASAVVTGAAVADGAGGLLQVDGRGVRAVSPKDNGRPQPGDVAGAGPDGYLVQHCGASGCSTVLYDRRTETYRPVRAGLEQPVFDGVLSAANERLAATVPGDDGDTVQVSTLATGAVLHTFLAAGSGRHDMVWLTDRWLAVVSKDNLVLYDSVGDVVVDPALPLSSIAALVWQPTT